MPGERPPAKFSLRSQLLFRLTGKCFETATSHMQTVVFNVEKLTTSMILKDKRFSFDGQVLGFGQLKIDQSDVLNLIYTEDEIQVESSDKFHPLVALEKLRLKLEKNHESLLGLIGCEKDTAYRPTGNFRSYKIEFGKPATKQIEIFETTKNNKMLSTVSDHKKHYETWLESIK